VLGVFDQSLCEPLAEVLSRLGSQHVLVVHGEDGMDEITIGGDTQVAELRDGAIRSYTISPEQFAMQRQSIDAIRVDDVDASLVMMRSVLADVAGPARDIVALNAGAAIYACGLAEELEQGVQRALQVIADGAAADKLEQLVNMSNGF
jgi:anthranilate phosphoribosyltransferase